VRYEDIGAVSFYTGQKIYLVHGISQDLAFGSRYPEAAGTFLAWIIHESQTRPWDSLHSVL